MKQVMLAGAVLLMTSGIAFAQLPSRPAPPPAAGYTYPGAWGPTAGTGASDDAQMTDTGTGALAGLALPETSTGWATSLRNQSATCATEGRAATREISVPSRCGTGTSGNVTGPQNPTGTGRGSGAIGAPGGGNSAGG